VKGNLDELKLKLVKEIIDMSKKMYTEPNG